MRPVILYRLGVNPDEDERELAAARKHFHVIHQRTEAQPGDLVLGRMSVLPFYRELEQDLLNNKAQLVNTYRQHQFIADMREWCEVLGDLTPRLYANLSDLPEQGPFVVKGQTNSKKHQWSTHMFAGTRREAVEVSLRLREDSLFDSQEIYARDYHPLVKLGEGLNGLPITKEFRLFVYEKIVICGAFYWASHVSDLQSIPSLDEVPKDFVREAVVRIGENARFYVLDVAQKQDGSWMVVEINDAQMSGLSCNDPEILYSGLAQLIKG